MLIIDDREPKHIIEALRRLGAQVKVRRIDVGDYIIGELGIERKSVQDFYRSIIDKRIFDQLMRLRDAYKDSLVIVEGDIDSLSNVINKNVVLGGLISIVIDFGVKILYSSDMDETIKMLYMIWRRKVMRRERSIIRYKPRIISKRERLIFILEGFPGVGHKLAENILNHYRTLRNFANTTLSEISSIEGIGEKKGKEIFELLNLDFKKLKE